jgi:hypothetical protein
LRDRSLKCDCGLRLGWNRPTHPYQQPSQLRRLALQNLTHMCTDKYTHAHAGARAHECMPTRLSSRPTATPLLLPPSGASSSKSAPSSLPPSAPAGCSGPGRGGARAAGPAPVRPLTRPEYAPSCSMRSSCGGRRSNGKAQRSDGVKRLARDAERFAMRVFQAAAGQSRLGVAAARGVGRMEQRSGGRGVGSSSPPAHDCCGNQRGLHFRARGAQSALGR